jgi:transketolase
MRNQFLDSVFNISIKNKKILFIGSDLGVNVLDDMKKKLPEQFFMEGISEQYMIGMSAGLALEGYRPYLNTIGSFITKRCYEQIYIDICLQKLPVVITGNGGGAVYAPLGPTHLNLDDYLLMKNIPNLNVFAPCDSYEMDCLIKQSISFNNPSYIRIGKGGEKIVSNIKPKNYNIFKSYKYFESDRYFIFTTGSMLQSAINVSIEFKSIGIDIGVLSIPCINPLDNNILRLIEKVERVFVIEEHFEIGGLGSSILDLLSKKEPKNLNKICKYGIPNKFVDKYGSQSELLRYWKLDEVNIFKRIYKEICS